ncbi:LacI family DNA-binding transcriptional regulator [Sphingomonas sp. IW22]|uniref:LacI family DNA-binding transcriptional regulator n=1 Tax=Sphingomonas sp. IW22 TaxID=3242489 RepID=UPI00352072CC
MTKGRTPKAETVAPRGNRRATSYDVARVAGVSQSAVSRCFAPGGSVSSGTRERILKVARELGYRPNALAQGLISGRTNLVAVLISSLTDLYYPEVLTELARQLTLRDMRMLLFSLETESEVDAVLHQVWRHSVDGVISAARLSDAQVELFAQHEVPLVLYNRTAVIASAASVCCDSVSGEQALVTRLLAAGHQRFAIIAGPEDSYVGEERRMAAAQRLAMAGINDVPVVRGDYSYDSGRAGLHAIAARGALPDAVICVSDQMAAGAMDAARIDLDIAVPDRLSVVGFDGSGPAGWASYEVTSIRQPVRRMTDAAVAMLTERIEDPDMPGERRLFAGKLLTGKSARLG